jgi:hypothetical protein
VTFDLSPRSATPDAISANDGLAEEELEEEDEGILLDYSNQQQS